MLGENAYAFTGELEYNLSYFAKNAKSNIGGTADGRVRNVTVVELQVLLMGLKSSHRTYGEQEKDLYETIRPELAGLVTEAGAVSPTSVFPIGTKVKRVKLRVEYDTDRKSGLRKMVEFTEASDFGLKNAPRHMCDGLFQHLLDLGIAKCKGVKSNDKDAGAGDSPRT